MTRIHGLTATAIAALLSSWPLAAQTASRTPNESRDKAPSTPAGSASGEKTAARGTVTYAALSSAMATMPDQSRRFVRTRGVRADQLTMVDVRNLFRNRDEQEHYEGALEQYARQLTEMRSTLEKSAALRDRLRDRGLKLSHVTALQTFADGRAIVFYQPE